MRDKAFTEYHKMKPFNLQAALAGAKVITRDGHKVSHLAYNNNARDGISLVAWVQYVNQCVYVYHADGKYINGEDNRNDLFMAPTTREGWINIFVDIGTDYGLHCSSNVYATKKLALEDRPLGYRTKTIRIEWEE